MHDHASDRRWFCAPRPDRVFALRQEERARISTLVRAIQSRQTLILRAGHISGDTTLDDSPMLMVQSAGSSKGIPKLIRRTQQSWIDSFTINRARWNICVRDVYAVLGRVTHSLALYAAAEAIDCGCDTLLLGGAGPDRQLDALRGNAATILYATPTQLGLLVRGARLRTRFDAPSIRLILCGGGRLAPALRMALGDVFSHAEIIEFYGASETSFIAISDKDTPEGSVGQPYPGAQVTIERPPIEKNPTAAQGAIGEIWVRSPYVFDGYAEGADPATRFQNGWLSIGEYGWMDACGYLYVSGRKSRMVTVADHNVFLEEITHSISSVCGTRQCAVVARLDQRRGHALVAYVEGEHDSALERNIRVACRQQFGAHAVPGTIIFLAKFPVLEAGKPDLYTLENLGQ